MGMPQFPDGKDRPTFDQTIIDLLESVALEEMAISHLLNAEGEKMQEIVYKFGCGDIDYCNMENGCHSTYKMISSLIMKEWLLMNKLGVVMDVNSNIQGGMQEISDTRPDRERHYNRREERTDRYYYNDRHSHERTSRNCGNDQSDPYDRRYDDREYEGPVFEKSPRKEVEYHNAPPCLKKRRQYYKDYDETEINCRDCMHMETCEWLVKEREKEEGKTNQQKESQSEQNTQNKPRYRVKGTPNFRPLYFPRINKP